MSHDLSIYTPVLSQHQCNATKQGLPPSKWHHEEHSKQVRNKVEKLESHVLNIPRRTIKKKTDGWHELLRLSRGKPVWVCQRFETGTDSDPKRIAKATLQLCTLRFSVVLSYFLFVSQQKNISINKFRWGYGIPAWWLAQTSAYATPNSISSSPNWSHHLRLHLHLWLMIQHTWRKSQYPTNCVVHIWFRINPVNL